LTALTQSASITSPSTGEQVPSIVAFSSSKQLSQAPVHAVLQQIFFVPRPTQKPEAHS
jgi:hypothetical protein